MNHQIQLPVSELKSILPGFSKVIGRTTSLPVLSCLRVDTNRQGEVAIAATNLDDYACVRTKGGGPTEEGAFLVPFEPLQRAVKGSARDDTIVLVDEGRKGIKLRTFVSTSAIDQKLDSPALKEWPPMPVVPESGMTVDEGLREAIQQAFECASQDDSRLVLNGAFLDVTDKAAHYVVGTNSRVLFSANTFQFDLPKSLIVPARKFLGWNGFWESEQCRLATLPGKDKEPGWVQFQTDRWTFITRQIEGNYPNWKQIVPNGTPGTIIRLGKEAIDSLLEVAPRLPGRAVLNSPITLTVENNRLHVFGRGQEDDKPVSIPISGAVITGDNNSVGVNREYLLRALRFGMNELLLFGPKTNVMVCQNEGRRLIIALLGPPALETPANPPAAPAEAAPSTSATTTTPTDERKTMTKNATPATTAAPAADFSAIKRVVDQIERIKETLKGVVGEFNEVLALLKTVEKEKKATDKEIESVRATLRTIQNVRI